MGHPSAIGNETRRRFGSAIDIERESPLPKGVAVSSPSHRPSPDSKGDDPIRAHDQQAATQEILQAISRSRDDEQPVFDLIVKLAKKLCGARFAGLVLGQKGDEFQRVVASENLSADILHLWESGQYTMQRGASLAADAILDREIKSIEDMGATRFHKGGDDRYRVIVTEGGIRSNLIVPLELNGQGIGCLMLARDEVRPYTENQVQLIETFATQAVIAIENARQFRELQTRLDREKATGDVLSVISRSRDDELPVFQAIHKSASQLCDAPFSGLFLVDAAGENLHLASHAGGSSEYVTNAKKVWPLSDASAVARAVTKSQIVHIHDLTETRAYRDGDEATVRAVDIEGTRTFLAVPLLRGDDAIGSIGLYRLEARPFTDDQIELLQTFAAQAVIAIDNVQQFREVQERLEREEASREILQVISASRTDPAPVFDVILKHATQLSGAPLANLALLNDERSHWHLVAHLGDGLRHLKVGKTSTPLDSNLVPGVAMRTASVVQIEDLTDTELYRQGDPGRVAMVEVEGMRTIVAVPLLSEGVAIGSITLFRREVKAFTSEEILLVETFAAQAVIAI